jgi:class 3 adenylate cyclase/tetratricopeptide (TPR) repeat protein/ABC-type cobalamin transport system ATPase subunit
MDGATRRSAVQTDPAGALVPHLPRLSIEWIANRHDELHRVEPGTVVFVDISGFTKLSEGLAKHGKVGAEELTATIGNCFVALLDLAVAYGGRLLKFGGDALLLYFSGDAHEARGCRAAVEMRRELRTVGRLTVLGQKVSLRMSVGVHSGEFNFFLVGGSHRELLVTGPAASATVEMEGTADAGQIVVSPTTAAALRPGLLGGAKGPGLLLTRAPEVPDDPFVPFEEVAPDADIHLGVPVGLRDTLVARHLEPEHRRVTIAFLHFDGTDELVQVRGPAEAADQLDELVRNVQTAADRHDVTFLATDVDHDGGKIILTAGAPSTSGDDDHRMLLCVREVMDAGNRLPVRIGVNRGAVFVGEIGPHYRRTFTVMGDAVNLAARLMAKARPGQIVVSPDVLSRSRTSFATEELEPFLVKGKAKPVRAFLLGPIQGERDVGPVDELPFVGRRAELQELERHASAAAAGTGRLVELVGEPGSGKSRLVAEVEARSSGTNLLTFTCQHLDASTAYHVVRRLLRQLLVLPAMGSDAATAEQFLAVVRDRAPAVLPWAPLIARAIGVPLEDSDETRDLDEEFRRPRLAQAVVDLLAGLLPASGLLCIDDAHFMDEASSDLFGHLAAAVGSTSWLICIARRDLDVGFTAPAESASRIDVGPLDRADALELAHLVTADRALSPRVIGALVDRSGGNPLFLRELLAAALGGGDVDDLPDTVDGVVAARIDSLASDDRFLLRQLSVLGQSFPVDLARDALDELPHSSDPVWRRLDEFVTWSQDAIGFRNGLLRDSAYDGLSFRQRRRIHLEAGRTLRDGRVGEPQPELLSFHFLHAQQFQEAWEFSLEAAERAKGVYANFEAAEFYERALTAGRRLGSLTPVELSSVHEELGDARSKAGDYAGAAAAYRAARRLVGGDAAAEARVMLKLAQVQGWLDRYAIALRWITKALGLLDASPDVGPEGEGLRAWLLSWYGRFSQEAGRHDRAIEYCDRAIEAAEVAGEQVALAEALRVRAWASMELGHLDASADAERTLAIYEDLGDLPGQANALNLLGMAAYWRGDWNGAMRYYERGLAIDRRTGSPVKAVFQQYNIGEILLDQGRFDEGVVMLTEVAREWRAAGYRSGVAATSAMLARAAAAGGDFDRAFLLFDEAVLEFRTVGSQADALETEARRAECLLMAGEPARAVETVDAALAQARALGGVSAQLPLLYRVRGAALARAGDHAGASADLDRSLTAAEARRAAHEIALTRRVLGQVAEAVEPGSGTKLLAQADEVLGGLGIVWTPDFL